MHLRIRIVLCISLGLAPAVLAEDMGTAFTYQGSLEDASGPVTDTCDFRFGLWDAAVGGSSIGVSPQMVDAVAVVSGVFTTVIDFGPGSVDGTPRWLEIEVQCPDDTGFTLLSPRTELTPVPYALAIPGITPGPPDVIDQHNINAFTIPSCPIGANPFDWQSFTCGITGELNAITIKLGGSEDLTFSVFSGTLGQFITSEVVDDFVSGKIMLTNPVPVAAGEIYTFHVGYSDGNGCIRKAGEYDGGTSDSGDDLYFMTHLTPAKPNQMRYMGIGTDSPASPVHVFNGDSGVPMPNPDAIGLFESDGDAYLQIAAPDMAEQGLLFSHTSSAGKITYSQIAGFRFATDFTANQPDMGLIIAANGEQVRINTATGVNTLDVNGDVAIGSNFVSSVAPPNGLLIQGRVGTGTDDVGSQLVVFENNSNINQSYFTQGNLDRVGINLVTAFAVDRWTPGFFWSTDNDNPDKPKAGVHLKLTSAGSEMHFGTSNNYATGITNNALVIDPSGDVGIGTTSPAMRLTVNGSALFEGNSYFLRNNSAAPGSQAWGWVVPTATGRLALGIAADQPTAGSLSDTHMVIDRDGKVGLGNDAPAHPLHVGTNSTNGNGAHVTAGGTWTNGSDRNSKDNFAALDSVAVLEKLAALPLSEWNYKGEEPGVRHIGPMAQDFRAAFGLGHDERYITTIDADGVALAAIQGLHKVVQEKDSEIIKLESEISGFKSEISDLKSEISELRTFVVRLAREQKDGGQ